MKNQFKAITFFLFAALLAVVSVPVFGTEVATFIGAGTVITGFIFNPGHVLGLNNSNNISARASFDKAKEIFYNAMRNKFPEGFAGDKECRAWVNNLKLSVNDIRLEVELATNNTSFVFGLTDNQQNSTGVIFNSEKRLTMQDTLLVNEYGFMVGKPSSRTATNWKERTYGNPVDFTAGAALSIDTQLYGKGFFRVTVNNDVIVPNRAMINHLYRPQTQQTAALGAASPDDQLRGAEDGRISSEPNMLLVGSKGYKLEVAIPAALTTVDEFSRLIFFGTGVLAQNSTIVS